MGYEQSLFSSTFGVIIIVIAIVLVVLWTLLPFAIFGIKGRLDAPIGLNRDIFAELKKLNDELSAVTEDQSEIDLEATKEPVPSPGVQICPHCGQKNSQRMTHCTKCGHFLGPQTNPQPDQADSDDSPEAQS